MVPYRIDELHNEPWHIAKVEPGGGDARARRASSGASTSRCSGTAHRVLEPRTVEMMGAVHRYGLRDALFGIRRRRGASASPSTSAAAPDGARSGTAAWRRHAGSPIPSAGLVMVVVCNGLARPDRRRAARSVEVTDAVYTALGDDAARFRREHRGPTARSTLAT